MHTSAGTRQVTDSRKGGGKLEEKNASTDPAIVSGRR
jgi:hypothetical protein